jgi:hypothetical protein
MSVSEQGEFKKFIDEKDYAEDINPILDEAKKEFPICHQDEDSLDFNCSNFVSFSVKAEKWFEKYFGTLEKTK